VASTSLVYRLLQFFLASVVRGWSGRLVLLIGGSQKVFMFMLLIRGLDLSP